MLIFERGCIFEHQIFMFAQMILPDRCSTSYDLASLFRGRRNTLERKFVTYPKHKLTEKTQIGFQTGLTPAKIAETHPWVYVHSQGPNKSKKHNPAGTRPSAQHATFHV